METRSSTLAGDLIVEEELARGMAFETAQRREDDGIDLIVEELNRCWEVTQDQDQSVEDRKGPFRDTERRQNGNELHVTRGWGRHFQQ